MADLGLRSGLLRDGGGGEGARWGRRVWLGVGLFLLAVVPFFPALFGEYTWDDDQWLVNNAAVHAWNGLQIIWDPWRQNLQYYPVTFSVLWGEHKLWGLVPAGYHAVNMVLHGGGAVVLWLSLRRLGLKGAWLAALVWAVHPVQADSVAWVAEIKNTLSGVLYFFAGWCYLKFEGVGEEKPEAGRGWAWVFYGVGLVAFVAALLSKTVVCTLPAALLVVMWWKRERLRWREVARLVPWFVVSLGIAAWGAYQEHRGLVVGGAEDLHFNVLEKLIICGKDVWFYVGTLVVPYPLMAIYPRWGYSAFSVVNYVPMAGLVLAAIGLVGLRGRIGKGPLAGLLFFLVTLSPALGFVNFFTMHYTFVADHYQYLACLGILAVVAEWVAMWVGRRGYGARVVVGVVVAGLMMLTGFYASRFQTNMKLWSWNVAHNPEAFTAQHNLGAAYLNAGNREEGLRRTYLALRLQPEDDNIQRTVGRLAMEDGRYEEALEHIQRAIALRPSFGHSYKMLGDVYDKMNRPREALEAYAKATAVDAWDPSNYISYAEALKKGKELEKAAAAYEMAIELAPGNMITHYNYGNVLLDLGKAKEAIVEYQFILKYQDELHNGIVWHNLAYAYAQIGKMEEARAAEERGVGIDAENVRRRGGVGGRAGG